MNRRKTILTAAAAAAFAVAGIGGAMAGVAPQTATPTTSSSTPAFGLKPFEYVGAAGVCGPDAGTDTVTAQWDSSTGNPAPSILLQKLGPTSNCAAAGVDILTPLEGGPVSALTELNFDYKTGEHCGGGAPRFNIQSGDKVAFLGCNSVTGTDAGNGYTHIEFTQAQITAALIGAGIDPATATLDDVYIIFDEGTDTPAGGTVGTPGTVHIDNISVNNQIVGSPTDECKNGAYKNFYGYSFKNQGDCVSFLATNGKNQPAAPKNPKLQSSTRSSTSS